MRYKKLNNIEINNFPGVSKVGRDTLALARFAGKVSGLSVLDVGTGTGFVAIYLVSLGKDVEAIDISQASIYAALKNAKTNNLVISCYQSNLFENVQGKFDIITFNPPVGTSSSAKIVIFVEKIKSILPRSDLLSKIGLIFFANQRRSLIRQFLNSARNHLTKNGKIIMLAASGEEFLLEKENFKIYKEDGIKIAVVNRKF